MATTEQLRAALAVLKIDAADVERQVAEARNPSRAGHDDAGIEHAMLTGLLYRTLAMELRTAVTEAPDVGGFVDRYTAVSPQSIHVAGENVGAQADFDAHWTGDRIQALITAEHYDVHGSDVPVPALLEALSHAAEATKVLLEIRRDHRQGAAAELTDILFETVTDRLERAYDLTQHTRAEAARA